MNKLLINRKYQLISRNNFVIFNTDFTFFISCDKEEYDNVGEKRIKRLEFHVSHNDYFGTLATSLSLLLEKKNRNQSEFLRRYADDLVYLQKLYKIIKK